MDTDSWRARQSRGRLRSEYDENALVIERAHRQATRWVSDHPATETSSSASGIAGTMPDGTPVMIPPSLRELTRGTTGDVWEVRRSAG